MKFLLSFFIITLSYHHKCWCVAVFNVHETFMKIVLGLAYASFGVECHRIVIKIGYLVTVPEEYYGDDTSLSLYETLPPLFS
jgi:hypothetical protein